MGNDVGDRAEVSEGMYHLEEKCGHTVYCNAAEYGPMLGVSVAAKDAGL